MLSKLHKSISNFLLNSTVQLVITVLILLNIVLIRWTPVSYLQVMSSMWMRLIFAVLVAYLVCIHPFYGVALTTLLIVILNENFNRVSPFSMKPVVGYDDVLSTAEGGYGISNTKMVGQIYREPIFNPDAYHQPFALVNAPNNISGVADEVGGGMPKKVVDNTEDGGLVVKDEATRELYNQHYTQTTSLQGLGGVHDIFLVGEHPASSTLTANVSQKQGGTMPYLSLQNLHDAQSNQVGSMDMMSPFPEIGNRLVLDAQGLEPHFPIGRDPSGKDMASF